ncbi:NmrA-like negative transcriptional regulator family protein [Hibiscus syriacus]|uniref:NmrA-like negative transcriptional regulator family protein n=1 Tax=Hibiscus syriacus TaxID=106335 RepID=A0A6A3AMV4_HIBSY|nr:NmrA-like negative transcriptional regulator family protein [Hibiscus syriacus]
MGKVKGKHRLDIYYKLAKEHGYRSRASWKLVQLDDTFRFLKSAHAVLNLCVIALQQDITKSDCKSNVKRDMDEHRVIAFDVVLHDGPPNVGTFVTKVFRSRDYSSILYCLKQEFKVWKPHTSRPKSAETYVLGLRFQNLLNDYFCSPIDCIYAHYCSFCHILDVDGETISKKMSTAADFIWSDSPLEILGSVTTITFGDPTSLPIKDHSSSTEEDKSRKATGMQIDALEDGYIDHELFSLSSIKFTYTLLMETMLWHSLLCNTKLLLTVVGKKDLVAVDCTKYDGGNVDLRGSKDEQNREESTEDESSSGDGDIIFSDHDSDMEEADPEANPLMIPLGDGEGPTQEKITDRWFGQDIFAEVVEQGYLGKYDSDDEMETDKRQQGAAIPERSKASKTEDDFEIVLAPATDSSDDSSSDDSEDDDVETKAEVLACAKKMLRKMQRDQILDDAYGKYMFHDDGLPKWFLYEEKRHCQPIKHGKQIKQLYKKAMPKKPQKEYMVARKGVQVMAGKGKVLVDRRMKKDAQARETGEPGKGGSKKVKNGIARKVKDLSRLQGARETTERTCMTKAT